MGLEIPDCHLCCIPLVASWWYQFHFHLVFIFNDSLHGLRYFIVEDVLLGERLGNALQSCHMDTSKPWNRSAVISMSVEVIMISIAAQQAQRYLPAVSCVCVAVAIICIVVRCVLLVWWQLFVDE